MKLPSMSLLGLLLLSGCGGGGEVPLQPTPVTSNSSGTDVTAQSVPATGAAPLPDTGVAPGATGVESNADSPATELTASPDLAVPAPEPETVSDGAPVGDYTEPEASNPDAEREALPALGVMTAQLTAWNQDWPLSHEALPLGVPSGYDWYTKGRVGRGNTPPTGFAAMIGWGQIFWGKTGASGQATAELRNLHTYVCTGTERRWTKLLGSEVTGAVFRPDYAANAAKPALSSTLVDGVRQVTFGIDGAYHFWPSAGRSEIPSGSICGILVMLEARRMPSPAGTGDLILGLGGDYWLSKTAAWDNYTTNADWGIGRLKVLTDTWRWYGMSTASNADLAKLNIEGFTQASR